MRRYCTHPDCRATAIQHLWWLAPLLGRQVLIECIRGIRESEVRCYHEEEPALEGPWPE